MMFQPRNYVRAVVRVGDPPRIRRVWAVRVRNCLIVVNKEGDEVNQIIVAPLGSPDIISEQPAVMSRMYAELELAPAPAAGTV